MVSQSSSNMSTYVVYTSHTHSSLQEADATITLSRCFWPKRCFSYYIVARGVTHLHACRTGFVFCSLLLAWTKTVEHNNGRVLMMADGSCMFTRAMGAELDLNEKGLGVRSRRYACVVEDGVVTHVSMEEGGELNVSNAEALLKML